MTTFGLARADTSPGRELVEAQLRELKSRPGWIDGPRSPSATPEELSPPDGTFIVGWVGEVAVACGGVKRLGEGLAELNRVYVAPAARGQGVSRELMVVLEDAARALGYQRVRMDTSNPASAGFCRATGYVETPDYNGNPNAIFWGEKELLGPRAATGIDLRDEV